MAIMIAGRTRWICSRKKAELLLGKSSSIQFVNKQNSIRILANGREPHDSNFEITEY